MVGKLSQQTEEVGAGRMTGKKEMAPGIKINGWNRAVCSSWVPYPEPCGALVSSHPPASSRKMLALFCE